jgi:hypothetical protein
MSWSYDTSLAADRDQVRFYSGDTDSAADITLSDEELDAVLASEDSVALAAARAADTLAILFGRKAEELTDDLGQRIKYGDRAGMFRAVATRLRGTAALTALPMSTYASNRAVW